MELGRSGASGSSSGIEPPVPPTEADQTETKAESPSKVSDIESSTFPDIGDPDDYIESPSPSNDADDDHERRPSEKNAPEPPRWRFVNEAKKSLGYSSLHAGSYIKGKSSEELGAKYVAPDISLYQYKKEEVQTNSVVYQLPENKGVNKQDVNVGKLETNVPPPNAFSLGQNEVGKIQIRQAASNEAQTPSGKFAGLPKFGAQPNESRKPFREWDSKIQLGPKEGRDHEWYDGKVQDSYTMPGGGVQNATHGEVGKLKCRGSGSGDETFNGDIRKSNRNGNNGGGSDNFFDNDYGDAREGTLFIQRNDDPNDIQSHEVIDASESLTEHSANVDQRRKKQRCLYPLLLLLLLLVVILGVLLGRKDDEEESDMAAGSVGGVLLPPVLIVNETTTIVPSLQPSLSPSRECPLGTKPFSIEHLQRKRLEQPMVLSSGDATWRIKDACSGEVIAQCLPCSAAGTKMSLQPSGKALAQSRSSEVENLLRDMTECLPIGNEFAFEVLPSEDLDPCCGFDPSMSIISYDNMVIKLGASRKGLFSSESDQVYFGEMETPCTSESPSASPIMKGSELPSLLPSQRPSIAPSSSPSTSPPTRSPVLFLGGCPEAFRALTFYNIGAQIESGGIIYECISFSCGSYGFEPGSFTSSLWRQGWEVVGSCEGSRAPTSYPTTPPTSSPTKTPSQSPSNDPTSSPSPEPTPRQRTRQPTNQPTPQPTCSTEQDFNLCLAVDMSGSVCNDGTGSECYDCQSSSFLATFLPSFFGSECRDSFVSEDTCCTNFGNVKEFSSLMVNLLGDFPAEKSFSVVQFSTNAQRVSGLSSAKETVQTLNRLDYTGGLTNHASAIMTCQQTMPSFSNRKNFIMLITDGESSEPGFDPEAAAEQAATAAKSSGTFIIPVFISPRGNDWSALAFMRRLSSDGKVFDVTDFDSLNSLQDVLVDQVSCA